MIIDPLAGLPGDAQFITLDSARKPVTPARPAVGFMEGDGTGPDIWRAARVVLDAAVQKAYGGERKVAWVELPAGEKAFEQCGEHLPEATLEAVKKLKVAIKGPFTTPVGGGFRSINVSLRRRLDLYACVRPVRWLPGVPSPVKHPELVDMVIFRENTEDVYAGIEWPSGSEQAVKLIDFLNSELGAGLDRDCGIGVKPMTAMRTKRLVRMALDYALKRARQSVTLVHKGNVQKYTEGAFRDWAYQLAAEEYPETVAIEGKAGPGQVELKDRIADNMFMQALLRPQEYQVLAAPNLNGDYLSDALAAQVGGLGMAPGANIGDVAAVFEATHGSAPKYAGMDKVNPCSLILSGAMMLEHMGWDQAADLIAPAISRAIEAKSVTYDLARQIPGAREVSCSAFGEIMAGLL